MANESPTGNVEGETSERIVTLDLTDLDSLASLARSSEDHEVYRVISGGGHFRIGLVVKAAPHAAVSFRIEVLLQILARDTQPRIADLECMNRILQILNNRGYSLDHHDSCWVLCERAVTADDIEEELEVVIAIVQLKGGSKNRCEEVCE